LQYRIALAVKGRPEAFDKYQPRRSEEMNLTDKRQDARIRQALRNADKKGQLEVVAAVAGIAGGVAELRRIMNSTDELSIRDRWMLAIHLG
jgi:hypothetical protein